MKNPSLEGSQISSRAMCHRVSKLTPNYRKKIYRTLKSTRVNKEVLPELKKTNHEGKKTSVGEKQGGKLRTR